MYLKTMKTERIMNAEANGNRLFYLAPYLPFLFPALVCLDYLFYLQKKEPKKSAYAKCWVHL